MVSVLPGLSPVIPLLDSALPLVRLLDPEDAHRLAVTALRLLPRRKQPDDPRLAVRVLGLSFPNPVGLAAGFDKDAEVPDAALALGFGFVEVGTLTPRPQPGNPRPRLFRLADDRGVVNRLGFNNRGFDAAAARLRRRSRASGIVGVNIGPNRDSADRMADYVRGVENFAPLADYLVVNVSSPNTPGLRDLQAGDALEALLGRVLEARARAAAKPPLLLKIAPDLSLAELDGVIAAARRRRIDGIIVSNTTLQRPSGLRAREAREEGGLSGRPLFELSTRMLAEAYVRAEGAFPLIGVGGVDSGESALRKVRAGATLVQLYTGMIFRGFGVARDIKAELLRRMGSGGLAAEIGADAAAICRERWPILSNRGAPGA